MKPPHTLFRYMRYGAERQRWVHDVLLKNIIFFPSPKDLNDPADCHPTFIVSDDKGFVRRMIDQVYPYESRKARRAKVARTVRKGLWRMPETISGFRQQFLEKVQYPIGICSFSENADNVLMWAHYADGHSGVCLGFDTRHHFFGRAQPITYADTLAPIDLSTEEASENVRKALLTKTRQWAPEAEWRILGSTDGSVGAHPFPSEALVELRLGARMSECDKAQLLRINATRQAPVKITETNFRPDGSLAVSEIQKRG